MQDGMIGQNIIITEPSYKLRLLGRNALAGKWRTAIIAMIIYTICLSLPQIVFDAVFGVNVGNLVAGSNTYGMDVDVYTQLYNSMPKTSILSAVYVILVSGAFQLGQTLFFLASFRKHDVKVTDIFLGFEKFGKALGLYVFQSIFIALWTLLFIVPGLIAAIRYSQAFFILADNPEKSIRQCMNESKAMMNGNKWRYFALTLSFIGWAILGSIPSSAVESFGHTVSSNEFVSALFILIGSLFMAPVTAYMMSSYTGFYEILAGHLIKETKPVPVTIEEARQLQEEIDSNDPDEVEIQPAAPEPLYEDLIVDEAPAETAVSEDTASYEPPALVETPVVPEVPAAPAETVIPAEPAAPEAPVAPAEPVIPVAPAAPEIPAAPETAADDSAEAEPLIADDFNPYARPKSAPVIPDGILETYDPSEAPAAPEDKPEE